jgi:flagellar basal body-associated protein FliL
MPTPKPAKSSPVANQNDAPALDELTFEDAPVALKLSSAPQLGAQNPSAGQQASQPASDEKRPETGSVKRRVNRMPFPSAVPKSQDVSVEEPEEQKVPKKPLPPWVEQIKQPKIMVMIGGAVVLLVLMICLTSAWMSASQLATEQRERATSNKTDAEREAKARKEVEWKLSESETALAKAKKAESDAKAALAAAQLLATETNEKLKKAETDRQEEYDKRKSAEAKYDDLFTKNKATEAAREEDYRVRNDMRKKYDEESRLRKELNIQYDETKAKLEETLKNRR